MKHAQKQALRELSKAIPECDVMDDASFYDMLDDLGISDEEATQVIAQGGAVDNTLTDTDLTNAHTIIEKYKGDPAWDKFIAQVQRGYDFTKAGTPQEQFTALVKALPQAEQTAGKSLEDLLIN